MSPAFLTTIAFLTTAAIHWLGFLALAGLIGSLAVDCVVLPVDVPGGVSIRARLRRWEALCLIVLVVTTAGELVIRAQTMTGGGIASSVQATPTVLLKTKFGSLWLARFVGLGFALVATIVAARAARVVTFVIALGVALTTTLTGHAGDWGDISWSAGIDWVHVVATAAWAGGLMGLAGVALTRVHAWPAEILGVVAQRFSRLAGWCLLAVVASGSYNTWVQVRHVSAMWTTPYGRVLSVKLFFALILVSWGAVNRYTVIPHLLAHRTGGFVARMFRLGRLAIVGPCRLARTTASSRFRAYVWCETLLAIVVFGCTAVLIDTTPARHGRHTQHDADAGRRSVHVTMSELHESGGVPKGWLFTLPSGDAKRGRELFARLGCVDCHAVGGDTFPPPSRPGPELTDVGEHHPAGYLVESIVNPNAVIVEGPDYIGPDGRSIMPDYGDSLSVNDLINLVAYLDGLRGR
jgi:putative copper resistance protein D